MIGIYKITNKINGKCYIGQSNNIARRFLEHKNKKHEKCPSLVHAFKKYGIENFEFEVVEECKLEELDDKEIFYIGFYHAEYNRTTGGCGCAGHGVSDEVRKRLSECGKRQWERNTDEKKAEIISRLKPPPIGHSVSKATREKLRAANIGKKQSPETIAKRKKTMNEKKKNGWKKPTGRATKKVLCVETGDVFSSVKSVGEWLGTDPTRVSAVLCGDRIGQRLHGYHFKYVEGVETNRDECSGVGKIK